MKRFLHTTLIVAIAMTTATTPIMAQTGKTSSRTTKEKTRSTQPKEKIGSKISRFVKQAKTELEEAGHQLGDAIGFDDRVSPDTTRFINVDGHYYMRLVTLDRYTGADREDLVKAARADMLRRYPKAKIIRINLPDADWTTYAIKESGQIEGYSQEIDLYILAKDGEEGYIHAHYCFARIKTPGNDYRKDPNRYPQLLRADVMTVPVYEALRR